MWPIFANMICIWIEKFLLRCWWYSSLVEEVLCKLGSKEKILFMSLNFSLAVILWVSQLWPLGADHYVVFQVLPGQISKTDRIMQVPVSAHTLSLCYIAEDEIWLPILHRNVAIGMVHCTCLEPYIMIFNIPIFHESLWRFIPWGVSQYCKIISGTLIFSQRTAWLSQDPSRNNPDELGMNSSLRKSSTVLPEFCQQFE